MTNTPLPAFDLLVLRAVSTLGDGATGKAIRGAVETTHRQEAPFSAIYAALGRLRKAGLVQAVAGADGLSWSLLDAGQRVLVGEGDGND